MRLLAGIRGDALNDHGPYSQPRKDPGGGNIRHRCHIRLDATHCAIDKGRNGPLDHHFSTQHYAERQAGGVGILACSDAPCRRVGSCWARALFAQQWTLRRWRHGRRRRWGWGQGCW